MGHKKPVRIDPLTEKLPPCGVDSHAHLDMEDFNSDRDEVRDRAIKCGVSLIGNVFLGPAEYQQNVGLFQNWPQIFFLLGIHPSDAQKGTPENLENIEEILKSDARVKAVGEIGLDYHWDTCPRNLQLETFSRQMQLARKLDKPVVIHCRDAEEDCLTFLEAGGFKNYPLLWHCFGGDAKQARKIVENGWHISIPGSVTYPKNEGLREALNVIPSNKLLLETDCPYLSPVPWRGTRNEPSYIVFTARTVARTLGINPDELWKQCGQNAIDFFGLE